MGGAGKAAEGPWSHPYKFGKPASDSFRRRAEDLISEIGKGRKPQISRDELMDKVVASARAKFRTPSAGIATVKPLKTADMGGGAIAATLHFRVGASSGANRPWEGRIKEWAEEEIGKSVTVGCRVIKPVRMGRDAGVGIKPDPKRVAPDNRVYDLEAVLVIPPNAMIHSFKPG